MTVVVLLHRSTFRVEFRVFPECLLPINIDDFFLVQHTDSRVFAAYRSKYFIDLSSQTFQRLLRASPNARKQTLSSAEHSNGYREKKKIARKRMFRPTGRMKIYHWKRSKGDSSRRSKFPDGGRTWLNGRPPLVAVRFSWHYVFFFFKFYQYSFFYNCYGVFTSLFAPVIYYAFVRPAPRPRVFFLPLSSRSLTW